MSRTILIVDDEKNIRRTLRMVLEGEGYDVREAESVAEAERALQADPVDVVVLDVKLGDDSGLELLDRIKARGDDGGDAPTLTDPDTVVVMIPRDTPPSTTR